MIRVRRRFGVTEWESQGTGDHQSHEQWQLVINLSIGPGHCHSDTAGGPGARYLGARCLENFTRKGWSDFYEKSLGILRMKIKVEA
eukprot:2074468-Rhodomonas_salina.2